jgi:hypothetical protein
MTATTVIAAIVVLGLCFGLMVWGQRYLGEEKGRNPGKSDSCSDNNTIENPCAACRGCGSNDDKKAVTPDQTA